MADIKLTALPLATTVAGGDILYLVHDPTGNPVSQKTTVSQLLALSPPYVLPASVAHDNESSVFALPQRFADRVVVGPATGIAPSAFAYVQLEVATSAGHAGMVLTSLDQVVDSRKWRIINYQGQLWIDAVNDAENAQVASSIFKFDRAGNFSALGSILGSASVNTNGTMYAAGTITGNPVNSAGHMTAAGNITANGTLTVYGATACNAVSCTTINTNNNTITSGALNASGKVTLFGGSTGAYNVAPLEIQMPGNPRVSFHWPGAVAAQLGMDSAGTIRTFDNPGTGYCNFACGSLTTNGNLTTPGGHIYTNSITCTNINTQGYGIAVGAGNVTCGTLNVSGQTWVGAIHSYGACNSASMSTGGIDCTNINLQGYNIYGCNTAAINAISAGGTVRIGNIYIQADSATDYGLPFIRAAAAAHMVINARPLYLNLDYPGNAVICNGNVVGNYGFHTHGNITSNGAGTLDIGNPSAKFRDIYLTLRGSSGPTVLTGADGALYYVASSRALKKNFRPADLAKSKALLNLTPQYYQDVNAKEDDPNYFLGVMADEVPEELQDLMFRATRTGAHGQPELMESFHYDRVAMHLLVVVKDMQRRIDELEARIH